MTAAAIPAERRLELSGGDVRRLTRRATAARAGTSLLARLGDVVGGITSIVVVVAVAGGTLARLRISISGARPLPRGVPVPAGGTAAALGVLALAGLVVVLDRLGPVSSTPAAAAWWLPLPAGRRGLLRPELLRLAVAAATGVSLLALPVVLGLFPSRAPVPVLSALGAVAGTVVLAVGATAWLQTRALGGRLAPISGTVAVGVAVLAASAGVLAALGAHPVSLPAPPRLTGWPAVAPAALGLVLLALAVRGLDRLSAAQLRAGGLTTGYAMASVLSLDTRELGRALAARPRRPRRAWRFSWVSRPASAVVASDLAVLSRGRWQQGQLATAVAVPVLVAHTAGLGSLTWAVWGCCVLSWALAAVAAGHPARQAQAAPALDRLLPLSAVAVLRARFAVPMAVTAGACAATGALLGAGTRAVAAWALLGLAVAPAWGAAALRAAYRPELDWSGQVLATPVGPVPAGVVATLVQGFDVGALGSLPVLAALSHGEPTAGLVVAQLAWSVCLAGGTFALLRRRAERPRG